MQCSITVDYAKQILSYLNDHKQISSDSVLPHDASVSENCISSTKTKRDRFYTIMKVNLLDQDYECLFSHNCMIDKDLDQSGDYHDFTSDYINHFVYIDDRQKVAELLDFNSLKENLTNGLVETTFLYRRKEELSSDSYVWVEIKKYISPQDNLAIFTFHDFNIAPELIAQMQEALIEKDQATINHYWEMVSLLKSVLSHNNIVETNHHDDISYYTEQVYRKLRECYPELGITEQEIREVSRLAPIHDIGKVKIPIEILNKKGSLSESEMEKVKEHPTIGAEMTSKFPRSMVTNHLNQYSYNICISHHERYDGNGYPNGLKGDEIPLCAQVVGLVDAYDALINERPYKGKVAPQRAVEMISNGECGAFRPKC